MTNSQTAMHATRDGASSFSRGTACLRSWACVPSNSSCELMTACYKGEDESLIS